MNYQVVVTKRARQELERAYEWYAENSPQYAPTWYNSILDTIGSLANNPQRCAKAPEDTSFPFELRQLLSGRRRKTHRILFMIRETKVVVLFIRHVSQREVTEDDL